MLRLTASTCILLFFLLINATLSPADTSISRQLGLPVKTIYLDPAYGGKECGPQLRNRQCGKTLTLLLAQTLQKTLSGMGFIVYLSRDEDVFMSLDDRVIRSKKVFADVYLRIKLSIRSEDCIRLFTASIGTEKRVARENRTRNASELNSELDKILRVLANSDKDQAGSELTRSVESNIIAVKLVDCIKTQRVFDYILINASMPSLTIDFGISDKTENSYILDQVGQSTLMHAIASSIGEYRKDHSQSQPH